MSVRKTTMEEFAAAIERATNRVTYSIEEVVDIKHLQAFMRRAGRDVSVDDDTLREELRDDPTLSDDERRAYLDNALDAEWASETKGRES